ncbi:hypothetical protein K0M31_017134 [Melipona bicolor]|uniref:Uncharacterized protein n=1 Tax=Melipona bicolor TaxID=60889 RepID=A0AA40FDD6_9HYME|nr:hypothetical protein K0M31_017134 [Melipona bicolor]
MPPGEREDPPKPSGFYEQHRKHNQRLSRRKAGNQLRLAKLKGEAATVPAQANNFRKNNQTERGKRKESEATVTTGEKDERNICQVVREFAFSQSRPMECPRLPVRRVELLGEVKREKSKRESYLAVRAFKIAPEEGFQRIERGESWKPISW